MIIYFLLCTLLVTFALQDSCIFTISSWQGYNSVQIFFHNLLLGNPSITCLLWIVADTTNPVAISYDDIIDNFDHKLKSRLHIITTDTLSSVHRLNITLDELAFKYKEQEFALALKPLAFQYLFNVLNVTYAFYFDTDIWITDTIKELYDILAIYHRSVVLGTYSNQPLPEDGYYQKDINLLRTGVLNGAFIGFKNTYSTQNYITWWFEKLSKMGYKDYQHGMNTDPIWHSFIPAFFDHHDYYITRNPKHNLAYWNLHYIKDNLKLINDTPYLDNEKVTFMHMQSVSIKINDHYSVESISPYQNRYTLSKLPNGVKDVYVAYMNILKLFDINKTKSNIDKIIYGYDRFNDGTVVSSLYKDYFKEIVDEDDLLYPHKFTSKPEASELFLSLQLHKHPFQLITTKSIQVNEKAVDMITWFLNGPYDMIIDLTGKWYFSELEYSIYQSNRKIQNRFKYPLDRDYWKFKQFFIRNYKLFEITQMMFNKWKSHFKLNLLNALHHSPSIEFGINVLGWHKGLFGVGTSARCVYDTLKVVNAPIKAIRIYGAREHKHTSNLIPFNEYTRSIKRPINILVANADNVPGVLTTYPEKVWNEHYNIGIWAWELSIYPDKFMKNMKYFDELWLPSTFIKDAVVSSPLFNNNVSIHVYPFGYPEKHFIQDEKLLFSHENDFHMEGRSFKGGSLDISSNAFVFLLVFDYYSYFDRKNPLAAVNAFREAFSNHSFIKYTREIVFIIKLNNKNQLFLQEHTSLMNAVDSDSRIHIIDGHLTDQEINYLHSRSDVYISLHRSEGFGLNILHAMVTGKITIATDYSGNADFFKKQIVRDAHFPIPYHLIPVNGTYSFAPYNWVIGAVWADPIHSFAVHAMKQAYELDLNKHRKKLILACNSLKEDFGDVAVGEKMLKHLKQIPYQLKIKKYYKLTEEFMININQTISRL